MEINGKIIVLCLFFLIKRVQCEDVIVSSPVGVIRGSATTAYFNGETYNISTFLGIPYGKSTAGQGRFAKPVKRENFTSVYNATEMKPSCPQNINWGAGLDQIAVSEDCLNLNIFAPAKISSNDPKAVMIFIYGGGFQFGLQDAYTASALTALHDIVYVTMNYRLGIYGFLANKKHGLKGNYGLWDQHMAIQWVHDNIAAFGGDPGKVTVFGESAGAVAAMYQALYKGNKGLVHRVIAQSGAIGTFFGYSKYPESSFDDLARRSGCEKDSFESTIACLRGKSVDDFEKIVGLKDVYSPIDDGDFFDYDPEDGFKNMSNSDALDNFANVDAIIGLNSDEGLLEMSTFALMLGENISYFSNGASEERFIIYMNTFLYNINKTKDTRVMKSIKNQYSDWNSRATDVSRRSMMSTLLKDVFYTAPAIQSLHAHLSKSSHGNTYMYYFEHKPSYSPSPVWIKGADHTEEIPFVLGFPGIYMFIYGLFSNDPVKQLPEAEANLSIAMMKYWSQFAKTGNPNIPEDVSLAHWPQYNETAQEYISLKGDGNKAQDGYHFMKAFNYWTAIFPDLTHAIEAAQNKTEGGSSDCYIGAAVTVSQQCCWTSLQIFLLIMIVILV